METVLQMFPEIIHYPLAIAPDNILLSMAGGYCQPFGKYLSGTGNQLTAAGHWAVQDGDRCPRKSARELQLASQH